MLGDAVRNVLFLIGKTIDKRSFRNEEILQYAPKLENLTLDTIDQVVPKLKPLIIWKELQP